MSEDPRREFFDRLSAAIEDDSREEFDHFRRVCEALPIDNLSDALTRASLHAVCLAVACATAETEEIDLTCAAVLHAFEAHRSLRQISQRLD